MDKYNEYVELFKSKDCELLTTFEEFNELKNGKNPVFVKVKFIASCGHDNEVIIVNFKHKNSGVTCKDCIKKDVKNKIKVINNNTNFLNREVDFTKQFQELIKNEFDSLITEEGCKSDLLIKPININEDKWMKIQIKTTQKECHKIYSFRIHRFDYSNYDNHLMLFYCINEDKYWLIPYENVKHVKKQVNIGLTEKSEYYKYNIKNENIINELKKYYNNFILFDKEESIKCKFKTVITEIYYRQKIYDNLSFLIIEKPEYTNMAYDLIINNKKIQEKVGNLMKNKKGYNFIFFRHNFSQRKKLYLYNDNDFYWLHIPETEYFYVIPEFELIYKDIISFFEKKGSKSLYVHIEENDYKHSWANKYLFNYKNIEKEKLLKLLENNYDDLIYGLMYIKIMEL